MIQLDDKDHVTGIVSSADVEKAKPAPDNFHHTLVQSGGSPHESIVIGDTIWDIQAARGCRLRTIAVMTGGAFSHQEFEKGGAVGIFKDCAELFNSGFSETFNDSSQS